MADDNDDSDPDNDDQPVAAPLNPLIAKGLTEVAIKLMYHYSEIVKAWRKCGSDKICRGEQVVHYISSIFGMSRPALLLSEILRQVTNRMWIRLRGQILLGDSDWNSTGLGLVIYGILEWILAPAWGWVDYAAGCLKKGDCEEDDILIWITNMKRGYCETDDDGGDDHEVDLDMEEEEIEDSLDWCTIFWNESPLIMLSVLVWLVYAISLAAKVDDDLPPLLNGNNGGRDGGGGDDKGDKPKGDDKGDKPEGDDKGDKPEGDDKGDNPKGDDKGDKPEGDDKGDKPEADDGSGKIGTDKGKKGDGGGDKGNDINDEKKAKPKDNNSEKKTTGASKAGGESSKKKYGGGKASQELLLSCPCCGVKYAAYFPDPVAIFCEDCGGNAPSSEPSPKPPPKQSQPKPYPRNAFHHDDHDPFKDTDDQALRCADWKVAMSHPDLSTSAYDSLEDLSEYELCQLLWETAEEHYDKLIECLEPVMCPDCDRPHPDHIHTDEESEEYIPIDTGETQSDESNKTAASTPPDDEDPSTRRIREVEQQEAELEESLFWDTP